MDLTRLDSRNGRRAIGGFVLGVLGVAVMGAGSYLGAQSVKARRTERPGAEAKAAGHGASGEDEEAKVRAFLAAHPDDLERRLDLARLLLRREEHMEVWNETQFVLERSPGHPRALSYQSLVRLAMGQPEVALRMLREAKAKDPGDLDTYAHLALVLVRLGQSDAAAREVDEASRRFPAEGRRLRNLLAQMQAPNMEASPSANPHGNPHASLPLPLVAEEEGLARAARSEGAGATLGGVVALGPGLERTIPPGAVLFVVVREAGAATGAPVAAKRLPAASFPVRFQVTAADSMMGQALPARARIEARLDWDGDPSTRDASEPFARVDSVSLETEDLRLVLVR